MPAILLVSVAIRNSLALVIVIVVYLSSVGCPLYNLLSVIYSCNSITAVLKNNVAACSKALSFVYGNVVVHNCN